MFNLIQNSFRLKKIKNAKSSHVCAWSVTLRTIPVHAENASGPNHHIYMPSCMTDISTGISNNEIYFQNK